MKRREFLDFSYLNFCRRLSAETVILLGKIAVFGELEYRMGRYFFADDFRLGREPWVVCCDSCQLFPFFLSGLCQTFPSVLRIRPFLQLSFCLVVVPSCHGKISCIFFSPSLKRGCTPVPEMSPLETAGE